MALRFLSDAQREQLSGFPSEVDAGVLDRFFTLSGADLSEVRRRHGDSNRLGWALQLCGLRMLGFCSDDVRSAPAASVRFVARQLDAAPVCLDGYGVRTQTRTDHLNQVKSYLGFRSATPADLERLGEWLAAEALVQDRPIVLFHLACAQLYELGLVRPGLTVIERSLVGAAREAARRETARRVAPLLTAERRGSLDRLLEVDAEIGTAPATWLRHSPVAASPGVMTDEMDKLVYLRELGAEGWDLSVLPPRRVAILAAWAQAASNQALAQSSAERRYPALLAFGAERLVGVVDGLVDLFDKLLADTNAKARSRLAEYHQAVATAANDKVLLLAQIVRVLLAPDVNDGDRLGAVFEAIPKDRLVAALADCERIARPADDSHIDLLGDHYSRLRQCVPRLLGLLVFRSERDHDGLLAGLDVLRELNRTGRRKVPPDAPLAFVPKTWLPFVVSGEDKVSRRFWELALLWRLRDSLRSGDVWVQGSRRYADPETYLLDRPTWEGLRADYCAAVERPPSGPDRLAQLGRELDTEVASFAAMLEAGEGPVRLNGDRLVVGRDTGDDLPVTVERLKGLVLGMFPEVELTEVVIAVDAECGFSQHLLHSAGAKARSPAMLTHLYAAILAQATNLGPVAMARASGLSYEQVAHATAWYLRDETLTAAIDEVINYHHGLPSSRRWGDGTFSSSDGQRFPVQVKAANAGALPRYFGFGKGISVLFALDEIFALRERDSDLDIAEHTTDTAGFTDLLFGAYDLVGLGFLPRIRDLADQRLWHLDDTALPALVELRGRRRRRLPPRADHDSTHQRPRPLPLQPRPGPQRPPPAPPSTLSHRPSPGTAVNHGPPGPGKAPVGRVGSCPTNPATRRPKRPRRRAGRARQAVLTRENGPFSRDQLIPGCWAEHGALVEELTTLFWSRHLAFEATKPTVDLAQIWHQQNLAGFYQRLRWWLGDSGRDCRAGQHPDQSPAVQAVQAKTEAAYAKRREQLITLDGRWRAQRVAGADGQP